MVTKRVSSSAKTVRPRAKKPATSELTDGAAMVVLESAAEAGAASSIDPEVRRQLVAAEAYFRAERRGFAAGREIEDWIAAEGVVDSRFNQMQVA
jgi:Protein of unknown function (DUF2934)